MKKNLFNGTIGFLMSIGKKPTKAAKAFFSFERGACKIMDGLNFKTIPVSYPSAIVQFTERKAQIKFWNVAVKTTNPEIVCRSHAEWMVEMQFTHANVCITIGEYERMQVLEGIRSYSKNVAMRSPLVMKNN